MHDRFHHTLVSSDALKFAQTFRPAQTLGFSQTGKQLIFKLTIAYYFKTATTANR